MPISRSRKHKIAKKGRKPKQPKKQSPKYKIGFFSTVLSLWKVFLVTLAVLSGAATLYALLLPRISVSSAESLDPSNPFKTPFIVRNDGYFPIHNVRANCFIDNFTSPDGFGVKSLGFSYEDPRAARIEPGGVATIQCPPISIPSFSGSSINMVMAVSFQADYSPKASERRFRFVTAQAKDGTLHWQQQPE